MEIYSILGRIRIRSRIRNRISGWNRIIFQAYRDYSLWDWVKEDKEGMSLKDNSVSPDPEPDPRIRISI